MATFYSAYSNGYRLILEVTETSQDQKANKSYLSWVLKMSAGDNYYQNENTKDSFKVIINGTTVYNTSKAIYFSGPNTTLTVASGKDLAVAHNTDGSKTVAVSFSFSPARTAYYYPAAMSGSGNMTLTKIIRQATLVSAPNFNDEANPTITYSNPLGNSVTSLQACISVDGSIDDVPYRDISKTSTSYTFELTEEERNALRAAVTGSNSRTVIFYVRTIYNGETYHSTSYKTFTIINGAPVITDTFAVDTNPTSLNLTKNGEIFIKGYNTVQVQMTVTPQKGATITSQKIYCGDVGVNAASGTLNNVEGRIVTFEATDNRGNTTKVDIVHSLINYFDPTCALEAGSNNAAGSLNFNVKGQMFTGSFGSVNNSYGVQYRLKEAGGEWGDWVLFTMNAADGAYIADNTISINYQKRYELQARVFDELRIVESNIIAIAKAIPVFDWGENDFNLNVPLHIQGVPVADFPIEVGYSNGWYYEKWNSGKAECWRRYTLNTAITYTWGSVYYSDKDAAPLDYPFTFAEVPNENATIVGGDGFAAWIYGESNSPNTTTTSAKYRLSRPTAITGAKNFIINYQVKGRWK